MVVNVMMSINILQEKKDVIKFLKDKSFFDFGYEKMSLLEEEKIDFLIQIVCS